MIRRVVEFIISAIIGIIAAFLLLVITGEHISLMLTAIIVGIIISAIVFGATQNQSASKLYSVFSFIVSFLIYLYLLITVNESPQKLRLLFCLIYFGPYIIFTYLMLVIAEKNKNNS